MKNKNMIIAGTAGLLVGGITSKLIGSRKGKSNKNIEIHNCDNLSGDDIIDLANNFSGPENSVTIVISHGNGTVLEDESDDFPDEVGEEFLNKNSSEASEESSESKN